MKSDLNIFLAKLRSKNIKLSFRNGKIRYSGPEREITPMIIEEIRQHKAELLRHLWPYNGNLMPINPVAGDIPFVYVHGEKANYLFTKNLPGAQPIYGYLHLGSEGESIPYKSVEELAEYYLGQLLEVLPSGPYILGGTSFGGLVAYQMGVRLLEMNQKILGLILLDCGNLKNVTKIPEDGGIIGTLRHFIGGILRKVFSRMKKWLIAMLLGLQIKLPPMLRNRYILNTYNKLTKNYHPRDLHTHLLLFRATKNGYRERELGWKNKVDHIRVVDIEGTHTSLLTDKESEDTFIRNTVKFIRELSYAWKEETGINV